MIRKKMTIEVEVTYDPECDMGYIYLYPKDLWRPLSSRDGCIPVEDKKKQLHLVTDWREGRLVGIEFFGRRKFPLNIDEEIDE